MGRPLAPIDEEQVLKLAQMMCTQREIAAFFDVSVDTIHNRFSDIINKGHEIGKMSLRRKQWKLAEKNAAMAIFLGKNYLGQSDKIEHEGIGSTTVNVTPGRTYIFRDIRSDADQGSEGNRLEEKI